MQSPGHIYIPSSTPYRANISLIMLFVLIVGSLIGLMTTIMMQSMIRDTSKYYETIQAHYTAKAGIELGTLAVQTFGYGYADHLSGDNDLLSSNLTCLMQKKCTLDLTIDGRGTQHDVRGDFIPKDGFVIPLIAEGGNLAGGQKKSLDISKTTQLTELTSHAGHAHATSVKNIYKLTGQLNLMQLYSGKVNTRLEFTDGSAIISTGGNYFVDTFNKIIIQFTTDNTSSDKGNPFVVIKNTGLETGYQMTFTWEEGPIYPPKTVSAVNSTASFGETFIGLTNMIDEPLLVDLASTALGD